MSHNFMSCIRGNVKKGLGQSGLFSDEKLHHELTGMSRNIFRHAFRETQTELRRSFAETRRKNFELIKELTTLVVIF